MCVFFPSFSPCLFSHLPPLDPRDDQQHLSVTASQRVGRPLQTRAQSLYPQSTLATQHSRTPVMPGQHWSFTRDPQQTRAQKDKMNRILLSGPVHRLQPYHLLDCTVWKPSGLPYGTGSVTSIGLRALVRVLLMFPYAHIVSF